MGEEAMKSTSLVIMAAGIGSRFGKGIKQLTPVGPNGEMIMEYSIHDALKAGFNKVVFIIRKDLETDFRALVGDKIEKLAPVEYVFQELNDLPKGFVLPEGRTKPWGTGQAILACKDCIKEPFLVINADDYYGKSVYKKAHDFLVNEETYINGKLSICMAGFVLGNTLSDKGSVTRGICSLNADNELEGICETHNIQKVQDGAVALLDSGEEKALDLESLVSMNMWGFMPEFFEILEEGFKDFLSNLGEDATKGEYLLPVVVDNLIRKKEAQVAVLPTKDTWFGVTYQEDRELVCKAFKDLTQRGEYPSAL